MKQGPSVMGVKKLSSAEDKSTSAEDREIRLFKKGW